MPRSFVGVLLLLGMLLVPALSWGQLPVDEQGQRAIEMLSAEIQALQSEVAACARDKTPAYCAALRQQILLLTAHRASFCRQFAVPKGVLGCL